MGLGNGEESVVINKCWREWFVCTQERETLGKMTSSFAEDQLPEKTKGAGSSANDTPSHSVGGDDTGVIPGSADGERGQEPRLETLPTFLVPSDVHINIDNV